MEKILPDNETEVVVTSQLCFAGDSNEREVRKEFKNLMGCAPWATESYKRTLDWLLPTQNQDRGAEMCSSDTIRHKINNEVQPIIMPNANRTVFHVEKKSFDESAARFFLNRPEKVLADHAHTEAVEDVPEENLVYMFRTDKGPLAYWRNDGHDWRYVSTSEKIIDGALVTSRRFYQVGNPFFQKVEYSAGENVLTDHMEWDTPIIIVQYIVKPGGEFLKQGLRSDDLQTTKR